MNRIKVAIVFGGCSEEHGVSVKSAAEITANIDAGKFDPRYIGITKNDMQELYKKPCTEWEANSLPTIPSPDRKAHGLLVMEENEYETRCIDVTFPVLHSRYGGGEDGTIRGLFILSDIPYVGCDIQSSAACMDKSLAYILAKNTGIVVPEFRMVDKGDKPEVGAPTYPVFVKPARSGSSFGVIRVDGTEELNAAIEAAGQYDGKILIEQAISGCEIGCTIMGNKDDLIVGEVDQTRLSHGIFRIRQENEPEKGSENAMITVPTDISVEGRNRAQEAAKKVCRVLGCRGLARVGLFLQENGSIVLNEVNTLPGFTSHSRYPCMMAAVGITLPALINSLTTLALER